MAAATVHTKRDYPPIDGIDRDTLAKMRMQERFQPAVKAIYSAQIGERDNGFAGLAFEGDALTMYWRGPLPAFMAEPLAQARKAGPVNVRPAAFSAAELRSAGDRIYSTIAAHGAADIQSIAYGYDGHGLTVTRFSQARASARTARQIAAGRAPPVAAERVIGEARVDVPVKIETPTDGFDLWASRFSDTQPWNGGGRWESWRGTDFRASCTAGFGVHSGGHSWILTAAHCASVGDTAFQGIFQGGSGTSFTEMGPINSDQWQWDLLLIDSPGWHVIFDGTTTTTTTKNVYDWNYWVANELVCQSGSASGTICDLQEVMSTDTIVDCDHPDSDGDCNYRIIGLIQCTQTRGLVAGRGGDSGGPVFTLNGNGVTAKGIVSGGGGTTLYFQDWQDVINRFGAYPNTQGSTS